MIIVYAAIPSTIVAIGAIALYIYIKGGAATAAAKPTTQIQDLSERSADSESRINPHEIMHSQFKLNEDRSMIDFYQHMHSQNNTTIPNNYDDRGIQSNMSNMQVKIRPESDHSSFDIYKENTFHPDTQRYNQRFHSEPEYNPAAPYIEGGELYVDPKELN